MLPLQQSPLKELSTPGASDSSLYFSSKPAQLGFTLTIPRKYICQRQRWLTRPSKSNSQVTVLVICTILAALDTVDHSLFLGAGSPFTFRAPHMPGCLPRCSFWSPCCFSPFSLIFKVGGHQRRALRLLLHLHSLLGDLMVFNNMYIPIASKFTLQSESFL